MKGPGVAFEITEVRDYLLFLNVLQYENFRVGQHRGRRHGTVPARMQSRSAPCF